METQARMGRDGMGLGPGAGPGQYVNTHEHFGSMCPCVYIGI